MEKNVWISSSLITMILGGGAGSRLYPLTDSRSKPAVPIAGKYRLVDIPISNCINSNINRIFVLTQYNSASLNKHIKNTYQFSNFSKGFVDILAAEQTPDNPKWFQGTADAVRQSIRHLSSYEYEHVLILSGDQLYQMDFGHMFRTHEKDNADITIATIPVTQNEAALAVVIGHEITHAIARHGNERMSQAMLAEGIGVAGNVLSSGNPQINNIFNSVYAPGAQIGVLLPNSRKQELEAYRFGLIFTALAGYNPQEAIPLWERMAKMSEGQKPPEFLSTHPSEGTRIDRLRELMPEAMKYYKPIRK